MGYEKVLNFDNFLVKSIEKNFQGLYGVRNSGKNRSCKKSPLQGKM